MNIDYNKISMRDSFISNLTNLMDKNNNIFFITADFGSPALDILRKKFPERFLNVGIAEQNLINISAGLALEGFIVYAYSIAPFITMRCLEQIRTNISILGTIKKLNINLIGVGAGVSYDIAGPSHHCLEDLSIIRTLPNIEFFSPSDSYITSKYTTETLKNNYPKYLRFDAIGLPSIYNDQSDINFKDGFTIFNKKGRSCIISTGYMTHIAKNISNNYLSPKNITVIDMFLLKYFNKNKLFSILSNFENLIILQEGFKNTGGLDSLVFASIGENNYKRFDSILSLGFEDFFTFESSSRENIHQNHGLDVNSIVNKINNYI